MVSVPAMPGHKTPSNAWLLATANGGIWRTEDILGAPEPHWQQVLDGQPVSCTSISAMSGLNGTGTVVAGCGSATSSEMGFDWMAYNGGDWGGAMVSHDGGKSWAMTSFPSNYYITAIVLVSATEFHVSARAQILDREDGGVWRTTDGGGTWERTLSRPVYDLVLEPKSGLLLAALPWTSDASSVLVSSPAGNASAWSAFAEGISWDGRTPFYPTLALGESVLFVGALTVNPQKLSDTASAVYVRPLADLLPHRQASVVVAPASGSWSRVAGAPPRLDRDGMPKDRMALLLHPNDDSMLFVAGNADALVWRVDWQKGLWTESYGPKDTKDGSAPHSDCRRYYWEPSSSSLLLLSDGGAFMRTQPAAPGGVWRSLAGDTGAMELVSAHWDPMGKRWVGGAQDNTVMATPVNASGAGASRAMGFIFGDGTVTAVDAVATPTPRLWGATQNLGNLVDADARPHRSTQLATAAGDDVPNYGFGFWQDGRGFVGVPLLTWFSTVQFAFFSQPFVLRSTDPTTALLYAGSGAGSKAKLQARGIYALKVPYSVTSPGQMGAPTLEIPTDGDVYTMIGGGVTAGKPDPSLVVAMNDTHLLHRSAASLGKVAYRPLPARFARPIVFEYVKNAKGDFEYVLGPTSHDKTVSLAVSPADSSLVAVTGWTSLIDNRGSERLWVSADAGASFVDATGNLREATAVIGPMRPSALLLLPLETTGSPTALLVGTSSGVYVAMIQTSSQGSPSVGRWTRFGACSGLPLVLVAGLSHEPMDDTLVAATMGRGVYVVHNASLELAKLVR